MPKAVCLLLALCLMLTGCGKQRENEAALNDWQINLLQAQGLPTEYDELTVSQQYSIGRIYKMITYLNEKYGEEFVYSGYIEKGLNEAEKLYA